MAASVAVTLVSGCLDLDLLGEMNLLDAGTVSAEDGSGAAGDLLQSDTEGSVPQPDVSDALPPMVTTLECGPDERWEQGFCIAEGPISASVRFSTDEPAAVTIDNTFEFPIRIVTDPWRSIHHAIVNLLPKDTDVAITLRLGDINGNEAEQTISVRGSGGPSVSITEVLADPFGAEPSQEFVEIVNIGESPVDISGFMVDDNDDNNGDIIPEGTVLDGGQIALLVATAFSSNGGEDPAPSNGTLLVRLDGSIGSNGLKNGDAEQVALYDTAGNLVSRYDGSVGPPKEGVSASRLFAELPDACPGGFAADPAGASPGSSPRLK